MKNDNNLAAVMLEHGRPLLLLALLAVGDCSAKAYTKSYSGYLAPGGVVTIENATGDVAAYPPALGQRGDRYTVQVTLPAAASGEFPLRVAKEKSGLSILSRSDLPMTLLVRVPKGNNLVARTRNGSLNISDLDGHADARTENGNIHIQMGGYANASTVNGNISVTMGSTSWPGSLRFQTRNGDVDVYVPAIVNAHVKATSLHGTVFTDFPIGAHADRTGLIETAEGNLGSGGRGLEILTHNGSVHLMKLVPQM